MAQIFFGSSWEDSRILPSCIVILVVFVLSIVVCNTILQVNMQHTEQYNTKAKHATHGSKMQYFPGLHNTPILQPTYNTQHSTILLHNMQHTIVKCDISQLCIMLQYCSPTCNTQCNTILQPNYFIGSSWLVSRQNNGNDNKT